MGEEALAWERATKTKQANKLGVTRLVRGPTAGQPQQIQLFLWRKPSNTGIFPLGSIWDVPDGLLHPCWRESLSKYKNAVKP